MDQTALNDSTIDSTMESASDFRDLLRAAATAGDAQTLASLLQRGSDTPDETGQTALIEAARAGHMECVKLLAAAGDPLHNGPFGTALIQAVAGKHVDCAKHLLPMSDPLAGVKGDPKKTALWLAVAGHNDAELTRLLAPKSGCLAAGASGETMLMRAARNQFFNGGLNVGVVEALLPWSDAAARSNDEQTALDMLLAAFGGDAFGPEQIQCIELLLAASKQPLSVGHGENYGVGLIERMKNADAQTPQESLRLAAARGDAEGVQRWLEKTADGPDGAGQSALVFAASVGAPDCVKRLTQGASEIDLHWALTRAAKAGSAECVDLLLAAGADPLAQSLADRCTALMNAAKAGAADCARRLLPVSDVHAQDAKGRAALALAILHEPFNPNEAIGSKECQNLLADAQDPDGSMEEDARWPALREAFRQENFGAATILAQKILASKKESDFLALVGLLGELPAFKSAGEPAPEPALVALDAIFDQLSTERQRELARKLGASGGGRAQALLEQEALEGLLSDCAEHSGQKADVPAASRKPRAL